METVGLLAVQKSVDSGISVIIRFILFYRPRFTITVGGKFRKMLYFVSSYRPQMLGTVGGKS